MQKAGKGGSVNFSNTLILIDSIPEKIIYNLNRKLTINQKLQLISFLGVSCKL